MDIYTHNTPFGPLQISMQESVIHRIQLPGNYKKQQASAAPKPIQKQLDAYFADSSFVFELPLYKQGTDFQQRVWRELRKIPLGKAVTYKHLAEKLGSHPRAIGQACKANPFPIVVPCHRVVAMNDLGGFAGKTWGKLFNIKLGLLQHEGYSPA